MIVFQVVRHQLLHGDGLPLSLLFSGFTFTNLKFPWSRSVWMNIHGASAIWLGAAIVVYIFFLGLIALVAGPASTVLLLPRTTVGSTGTTESSMGTAIRTLTSSQARPMFYHKIWLNGTSDDLWPTNLTAAHIGDRSFSEARGNDSCSLPTSIFNNRCVSTGYPKLFSHFNAVPGFFQWDWTLPMHEPALTRLLGGTEAAASTNSDTWAYAPHLATAFDRVDSGGIHYYLDNITPIQCSLIHRRIKNGSSKDGVSPAKCHDQYHITFVSLYEGIRSLYLGLCDIR